MSFAKVEAIYIATARGEPTLYVEQIRVVPGMGIEGDRYFGLPGVNGISSKTGRELTLIEMEAIESIRNDDGIPISPDQTRRNIITSGISLNNLVGQEFYIGSVRLRGVRLCEPCAYLASRTDPRILTSMVHRGGLRTDILSEGIIHLNDRITLTQKEFYV